MGIENNIKFLFLFFFFISIDRVKIINGIQPPLPSERSTANENNTELDEIQNPALLNVLNWSPVENLLPYKSTPPPPAAVSEENESRSKNSYNAVQISIELQKKMLK